MAQTPVTTVHTHRDARATLESRTLSLSLARARVRVYGGRESEGRGARAIYFKAIHPWTIILSTQGKRKGAQGC